MHLSIRTIIKISVFLLFIILYFRNNELLAGFAERIDREIITPYRRSLSPRSDELFDYRQDIVEELPTSMPEQQPLPTIVPRIIYVTPTPMNVHLSEDELWSALISYRRTHGKSDVQKEERLCVYARSRAKELIDRLATNPEDPLDAHAGFQRDADSGYVFETTGYNHVGENLAYTPGFTTATQIIEWGWDTSSGHRSLQLSDEVTHGCITGIHPIYVAIFTY